MQGHIRRLARERLERRDDARVPTAWIGSEPAPRNPDGLSWLTTAEQAPARPNPRTPVLIMLGSESDGVLHDLVVHASAGARVYVLVPLGWGKAAVDPQLLQAPRILFRRIAEVPAAAIHTDAGARLWVGGAWTLRLDAVQADTLRQIFLRLFWHDATEEAWSGGRQLTWRTAAERPFDVPDIPRGASVQLVPPDARLDIEPRGALVHLTGGLPPEATPRRLWFPASGEHHDRLARLARAGADIVCQDMHLPDLAVGTGSGQALLAGVKMRLRVRLNSDQSEDARHVLETPASWVFGTDVGIGNPALRGARFWLAGEAAARGVEDEQVIAVPDVPAITLRAVPDTVPPAVPEPQPLALTVRYRWTVVPSRLPSGCEEDALVARWHKLDDDWNARLKRVRELLQGAEGARGRIGRAFSRLVGAMLGFERTQSGLLATVAVLEARRPSAAGPSDAPALLDRLSEVEEQARKHQGDLDETERRAREEDERDRQQAAWRSRVDEANRKLSDCRVACREAEGRKHGLSEELGSVDESLKSADKDKKKDLQARRQKLSDELSRARKEVRRLTSEVDDLEERASEQFEFRPPVSPLGRTPPPTGRFVPTPPSARPASPVPDEALPEVGKLRRRQGQRYLVIQTWEELAAGELAATRLSAKLVAPEDV